MHVNQQVRRPLVGIACSFVAGIFVQQFFSLSPLLLLSLSAFFLAWLCRKPGRGSSGALYLCCLFLAAAYGAVASVQTPARRAARASETTGDRQEMIGIISGDPVLSEKSGSLTFRLRLEAVGVEQEWHSADSSIRVYIHSPLPGVAYGERWRLAGRYRSYESPYGGMDGVLYVDGKDAQRVCEAGLSLKGAAYNLRKKACPVFAKGFDASAEHTRMVEALMLGYRNRMPEDLYREFAQTGMLHIFAISGLHVGVMAAILIAGLKLIGISKPQWGWILIPLLFVYVVATGMKASAFRAFTMASVYFAAPLFRRRPDSATAIAVAAIILLGIRPQQLRDPGFLLSFTVVCGIVMVHSFASRKIHGPFRPGWAAPLAPFRGEKPLRAAGRAVALLALTSVAAWLFSAPLSARFFNTLSPVAVPGNLIIIPVTFLVVLTGCLSLLSAPVLSSMTILFNHANRVFVSGLISVVQHAAALPGASFNVRAPSGWVWAGWYTGLCLIFCGPRRWQKPGCLLVLSAVVLWIGMPGRPSGDYLLVERDRDDCTLFHAARQWVAVSRGDTYSISGTVRRLKARGINRVQDLAVTGNRIDTDAVSALCRRFAVQRIWLPPAMRGTPVSTGVQRGVRVVYAGQGDWPVGGGTVSVNLDY